MSMSVDGLISGMDTTALVNKLILAEASTQAALKTRLSTTQKAASAYRTVNTTFLAVTAAADAILQPGSWTAAKGTSSAPSVAVAVGAVPSPGTLSFTVDAVATNHSVANRDAAWTSATSAYGAAGIEIFDAAGVSKGTIPVGGAGTLKDAAAAINGSAMNLTASVVQVRGGTSPEFALQVTAKASGKDAVFSIRGAGTSAVATQGVNAKLTIGDRGALGAIVVESGTNTFDSVLTGATLTVSKIETTPVTVAVSSDPDSVATKMSALVDAVNAALSTVRTYTSNAAGSTATLKGDFSLTSLGTTLLDAVAKAVGSNGSPAAVGLQLTKDGKVTFDKAKFLTALKDNPALAQAMVVGTPGSNGPDGVPGGNDDVAAVAGVAARIRTLSKAASDATTGSIVALAKGQDAMAKDYQNRIDAWDLRLAKRKETLTRQFTAMETALSSLKNQSTWLAGQLNGLSSGS